MIKRLDALCLLVNDLGKSRHFYEDLLGLAVNSTDTGFVDYQLGETPLALFEKSHATAMFPAKFISSAGGVVVALRVDDVPLTYATLVSKGVVFFEPPKTTSWGQVVAYFHDPDGHIIEITSY